MEPKSTRVILIELPPLITFFYTHPTNQIAQKYASNASCSTSIPEATSKFYGTSPVFNKIMLEEV